MRPSLSLFLLSFFLLGRRRKDKGKGSQEGEATRLKIEKPSLLELSEGESVLMPAPPQDLFVQVKGRSIVYVVQSQRILLMEWAGPESGEILVPMRAFEGGKVTIGLTAVGPPKEGEPPQGGCPECLVAAYVKCCMADGDKSK